MTLSDLRSAAKDEIKNFGNFTTDWCTNGFKAGFLPKIIDCAVTVFFFREKTERKSGRSVFYDAFIKIKIRIYRSQSSSAYFLLISTALASAFEKPLSGNLNCLSLKFMYRVWPFLQSSISSSGIISP